MNNINKRFLCRGKREDNREWVTGYYVCAEFHDKSGCEHFILEYSADGRQYNIDPETLSQCTGLKDKNEKLIFEGDICTVKIPLITGGYKEYKNCVWSFRDGSFWCISNTGNFDERFWQGESYGYPDTAQYNIEIIGNIYDNPELS